MNLDESRQKFIQSWGTLGSNWGINRAMAQVHALLLIAPDPLTADEIMEQLVISRGSANMNVRALIDWGLVYRESVPGERKEFFRAEKDVYKMARQILKVRKQKELDTAARVIRELKTDKKQVQSREEKEFNDMMYQLDDLVQTLDSLSERALSIDGNFITQMLIKLLR